MLLLLVLVLVLLLLVLVLLLLLRLLLVLGTAIAQLADQLRPHCRCAIGEARLPW